MKNHVKSIFYCILEFMNYIRVLYHATLIHEALMYNQSQYHHDYSPKCSDNKLISHDKKILFFKYNDILRQ